jgi:hypothetical protein
MGNVRPRARVRVEWVAAPLAGKEICVTEGLDEYRPAQVRAAEQAIAARENPVQVELGAGGDSGGVGGEDSGTRPQSTSEGNQAGALPASAAKSQLVGVSHESLGKFSFARAWNCIKRV